MTDSPFIQNHCVDSEEEALQYLVKDFGVLNKHVRMKLNSVQTESYWLYCSPILMNERVEKIKRIVGGNYNVFGNSNTQQIIIKAK
jgi:hypothetical protein